MNDAISFLQALDATGLHNLVAISPETGHITGHTFPPSSWEKIEAWVAARNGRDNLYVSINEPRPNAPDTKLTKDHIGNIRAVFADLDPQGKAPLDQERAEIAAKTAALQHTACPPSLSVDSGGGSQFVWLLESKLPAAENREWAESQGRALRAVTGGDAVQNIDRIMRLPGTMNMPDAKKRAKGRTARQALVTAACGRTYGPEALSAWAKPISAAESDADGDAAVQRAMSELDMDRVRSASSLSEVNSGVPEKFQEACKRHPEIGDLWNGMAKPADDSGSGWRAALAGALGRAGGFGLSDYAALAWVWERSVSEGDDREAKLTRRALARDWTRMGAPKDVVSKWFDASVGTGAVVYEPLFPVEAAEPETVISATPWRYTPPHLIPRRETLYGGHYTRKYVSITVAQSKVGKTALLIAEALAMASGKPLLGRPVGAPLRVWLWNGEDPLEELERRVAAAMMHYGLTEGDLSDTRGSRLFLNSGRSMDIVLASETRNGAVISAPVEAEITKTLLDQGIDVAVMDPFISTHRVSENDNGAIDMVAKRWARIADRANCAVELAHHIRKLNGGEVTVEDGRGAVALLAASRSARALARMTLDESRRLGVEPSVARRLFRFADASSNISLPGAEMDAWHELKSISLGNGEGEGVEKLINGDSVGAVCIWDGATGGAFFEGRDPGAENRALQIIDKDGFEWRSDQRAGDAWIGEPIAIAFGLDRTDKDDAAKIKTILRAMTRAKKLEVYVGKDKNRNERTFIRAAKTGVLA